MIRTIAFFAQLSFLLVICLGLVACMPTPSSMSTEIPVSSPVVTSPTITVVSSNVTATQTVSPSVAPNWAIFPQMPAMTSTVEALYQPFEHGFMVWRSDENCAYALRTAEEQSASANAIIPSDMPGAYPYGYCLRVDPLIDGDVISKPPSGLVSPVGALGKVWTHYEEIALRLGYATQPETRYQATIPAINTMPVMYGGVSTIPQMTLPNGNILACGARGATAGTCTMQSPISIVSSTQTLMADDMRLRSTDNMTMVYIPEGPFIMGSADDDLDAGDLEKPQHTVYLDAFWIDQMPVTHAQYQRCVASGACQVPTSCDFGEPTYDDLSKIVHPVVCVNWHDAQSYCQWVGGQLPTEAQWEKAARGTDGQLYPWGNTIQCSQGNFDDETVVDDYVVPGGEGCDGYAQTSPVGAFLASASPYGVLDMAGNVWEWVYDWSDWEYYARSPDRNPTGPASGSQREVRGGSWHYGLSYMRAATRHSAPPEHRADALGFRCVMLEEQVSSE